MNQPLASCRSAVDLIRMLSALALIIFFCRASFAQNTPATQPKAGPSKSLNVLFIGNSYTARHHLAEIVKSFAEEGDPELTFEPTQVIYGGRTLRDHWRLGTQHFVNRYRVTAAEVKKTIQELESGLASDPKDQHASRGLARMRTLLGEIERDTIDRSKWDWVVLQSYRDDLDGDDSLYMQFVPRFAKQASEQSARVLLYETTPTTQNQFPIAQHQDSTPVMEKAKSIAKLARDAGASVVPMSYVALRCQLDNPEITLRFENDAHLNQTMAYLTACTIYAAMFDRSPEGIEVSSVTDIRYWQNDRKTGKDRDGKPITTTFSDQQRAFLQKTAWSALEEFKKSF